MRRDVSSYQLFHAPLFVNFAGCKVPRSIAESFDSRNRPPSLLAKFSLRICETLLLLSLSTAGLSPFGMRVGQALLAVQVITPAFVRLDALAREPSTPEKQHPRCIVLLRSAAGARVPEY